MIYETRTFKDIQDEIIDLAKLSDDAATRNSLKRKINSIYLELSYEKPYRWTGETRPIIFPAAYTDGTVTVTNGSDTVTGAATLWTENEHLGCRLRVGGSNTSYLIRRVASATSIVLDTPWDGNSGSGEAYSIFKDEYGLFPDLQDIRKLWVPGLLLNRQPVPCGPNEIDELRAKAPFRSGTPLRYTIHGFKHYHSVTWADFKINYDFWEDDFADEARQKKLVVWPAVLSTDKTLMIRYTKVVYPMSEDSDEPLIPYQNRMVLVFGTLMRHFLKNRDIQTKREWERDYAMIKAKMAGDIETTDDELRIYVDKSGFRRESSGGFNEEFYWEAQ